MLLPAAQTPEAGAAATPSSWPPTLNDPAGPATCLPGRAAGTAQGDVTAAIPAAPAPAGAPVRAEPQESTAHAAAANTTQTIGTRACKIPRRPRDMPLIPVSSTAPRRARPRLLITTRGPLPPASTVSAAANNPPRYWPARPVPSRNVTPRCFAGHGRATDRGRSPSVPGSGPGLQAIRCTVPAVTVRQAATTAMALASAGWPRPRAHPDHSFGCGTADHADRPSLATDNRRLGARYQELIAPLVNPTTADQPGARQYIYALPLLARTPASAAYVAPIPARCRRVAAGTSSTKHFGRRLTEPPAPSHTGLDEGLPRCFVSAIKLFPRVRPVGVVLLGPVGRGQLGHRRWRGPRWWPTAATLRASASAASAADSPPRSYWPNINRYKVSS